MKNKNEFVIINIEKELGSEKKMIVAASIMNIISSVGLMTAGVIFGLNNDLLPAFLEGSASILFGLSAGVNLSRAKEINNQIKALKK